MTITELRTKRAGLWKSMQNFLDTRRVNGVLSAEDDASYAKMEDDMMKLGNEIQRSERAAEIENELNKPVNAPILSTPKAAQETVKDIRASKEYRDDFRNALLGRPTVYNVLSTTPGTDGGYLIPTEMEKRIITALDEANVIRGLANVITTASEHKIPMADGHSVATWTAENAAYTESNPTFTQKTIDSYKLTDLVRVSEELLQDSYFDLEAYIGDEIVRAFAAKEEEAFCVGDGSGKPTGIFAANGGATGVTAASATAITLDELIALTYALKSPYRRNAKFVMNDATVAAIRKMKDGNGAYIWQPSMQAGQPDRLLGYELYTSPYAPTMASNAYAIAFGDYKNYWIADRGPRSIQRLNELYAANGQVGYRAYERLDAKVILTEGIQLLKMHA